MTTGLKITLNQTPYHVSRSTSQPTRTLRGGSISSSKDYGKIFPFNFTKSPDSNIMFRYTSGEENIQVMKQTDDNREIQVDNVCLESPLDLQSENKVFIPNGQNFTLNLTFNKSLKITAEPAESNHAYGQISVPKSDYEIEYKTVGNDDEPHFPIQMNFNY